MSVWNCNGSLRLDAGYFEDSFRGMDIAMYTETHQCKGSRLPHVQGYRWESVCRANARTSGGTRGSGGVAVLFREGLRDAIQVVHRDGAARYMWIRVQIGRPRDLYIAICYFPPAYSAYAPREGLPYDDLYEDIMRFASIGDVLLTGDFNARTGNRQSTFYMTDDEIFREIDVHDVGLHRVSQDGEVSAYGAHLLSLGSAHGLAIFNGMPIWPTSSAFTCWNHKGGASVVDYVLGSPALISDILSFEISSRPMGLAVDHAILSFSMRSGQVNEVRAPPSHIKYHFTEDTAHIYSGAVQRRLREIDMTRSLEDCTALLAEVLHASSGYAFPCSLPPRGPPRNTVPQNGWYDDECRETRSRLKREVATKVRTYRNARAIFRRLVRKKKRDYLIRLEDEMYKLFLGKDVSRAWKMFHERSMPIQIASPDVWYEYGRQLYDLDGQTPMQPPQASRPLTCTFFTEKSVRDAIRRLRNGKAYDHDGLVAEHLSFACEVLAPILTCLFNRAICEGFPASWSENTIVPLFKSGDPLQPCNYRTIMIGHILAKLYGSVVENQLSTWAEEQRLRSPGQAGFRRGFTTLDHIFTLRAIIEEGRAHDKRIYCCFVDFRKAFDSVPRARIMQRLQDIGVPMDMQWCIYALYETVNGRVRAPGGMSNRIDSTIGVKQGCPLSPTLFGIYIDEVSHYIDRGGGAGASLTDVLIPILLYADDIVLISDSPEGLQRHLDALQEFCRDWGLTVNLGKTKVMVFNTSAAWVTRSMYSFTFEGEVIECVKEYVYLGIVFSGPKFTLRNAAKARLARGYAALGALERQCAYVQFQEPRTKLWLFDTLVTPTLLYGAEIWGCSLFHKRRNPSEDCTGIEREFYDGWEDIERPLVMMISRMIRSKSSTPHDIVRAELGAAPLVVEGLLRAVTFMQRLWELPQGRYPRLALMSSKNLAEEGNSFCWYAQMSTWMSLHGMQIDRLPPWDYSLDCPTLDLSRHQLNQIIRMDIQRLDTERTWTSPPSPLRSRRAFYRDHFLHLSPDGFVMRPQYMDGHLSPSMRMTIGQIRTSSHQLACETGRWTDTAAEDRVCELCHYEPETEEHYICRCSAYYDIRGRYHCLFQDGFGPLRRVMDFEDQRCLGFFLLELQRRRRALLRDRGPAPLRRTQSAVTDFFQSSSSATRCDAADTPPLREPIPRPTPVARRGITLERAIAIGRTRRPRPRGPRPRHPFHRQIRFIIARHQQRTSGSRSSTALPSDLMDLLR